MSLFKRHAPDSKLREFRQKHGLTQKQLGDILGAEQAVVSQVETGAIRRPPDWARRLRTWVQEEKENSNMATMTLKDLTNIVDSGTPAERLRFYRALRFPNASAEAIDQNIQGPFSYGQQKQLGIIPTAPRAPRTKEQQRRDALETAAWQRAAIAKQALEEAVLAHQAARRRRASRDELNRLAAVWTEAHDAYFEAAAACTQVAIDAAMGIKRPASDKYGMAGDFRLITKEELDAMR